MTDLFPPFEPDKEPETKRFRAVPLRVLLPNLITLLSLAAGLTGIRLSIEGHIESALIAIVIAAVLDGLDGRIARLLKGTSRFGAELDSLSDFVSFGVAPAIILYNASLHDLKSFGWIIVLLFACASALRLARFNVMIRNGRTGKRTFLWAFPRRRERWLCCCRCTRGCSGLIHRMALWCSKRRSCCLSLS